MHPTKNRPRRSRLTPAAEGLETRRVLTAGAGNTIAILQGTIAQPGGTAPVVFTIDPANFTLPHNRMMLGVDIAAPGTSTLDPSIANAGAHHGPSLQARSIAGTEAALLTQVGSGRRGPSGPITYQATAIGKDSTSGDFLVGVYLPGDANGDGTVDKTDVKAIRGLMGATAGASNYSFDADSNRDGRINGLDMRIAQQNLGVKTTLTPVVTSNLDPASDTGVADRVTAATSAHFTGVASGGATITYSEIHQRVPDVSTTAAADGTYSLTTPLAQGSNQFKVTVSDSSGQKISGVISPVYSMPVLSNLDTSKDARG
jgi:hypothetical protein